MSADSPDAPLEEHLERLQSQLAHQDLAIEQLSDAMRRQERLIGELRDQVGRLRQRIEALRASPLDPDTTPEPPPPHY
jgi:SlyX protein